MADTPQGQPIKDKTPVREAPGVGKAARMGGMCSGFSKPTLPLFLAPCFRVPLFFRRHEPDQVRRVRLQPFFNGCSHLSAFAHPGAGGSIGQEGDRHAHMPWVMVGLYVVDAGVLAWRNVRLTQSIKQKSAHTQKAQALHALKFRASPHHTAMANADPACLRSSNFWILPVLVLGSSPKMMMRGTL